VSIYANDITKIIQCTLKRGSKRMHDDWLTLIVTSSQSRSFLQTRQSRTGLIYYR